MTAISMDDLFKTAAQRQNKFTLSELAQDLGVDESVVVRELKVLAEVDAIEPLGGWRLCKRKTEVRDALVLKALKRLGTVDRATLDEELSEFTSAQIYTSLSRLRLQKLVKWSRDGTRTPLYGPAD